MKVLLGLVFVWAFSAIGGECPTLEGDFRCKMVEGGEENIYMRQRVIDGVTYYFDKRAPSEAFVADGVLRDIPSSGRRRNAKLSTRCEEPQVILHFQSEFWDRSVQFGDLSEDVFMSINGLGQLIYRRVGIFKYIDGNSDTYDDTVVCQKVPS